MTKNTQCRILTQTTCFSFTKSDGYCLQNQNVLALHEQNILDLRTQNAKSADSMAQNNHSALDKSIGQRNAFVCCFQSQGNL